MGNDAKLRIMPAMATPIVPTPNLTLHHKCTCAYMYVPWKVVITATRLISLIQRCQSKIRLHQFSVLSLLYVPFNNLPFLYLVCNLIDILLFANWLLPFSYSYTLVYPFYFTFWIKLHLLWGCSLFGWFHQIYNNYYHMVRYWSWVSHFCTLWWFFIYLSCSRFLGLA